MKRIFSFFVLLGFVLNCNGSFGQESSDKNVIRSFLNRVLTDEPLDTENITKTYITLQPISDGLVNTQKDMLEKHLLEIKKKYKKLYDAANTSIIAYKDLNDEQKIPFDEKIRNHIYAVVFSSEKLMYVYTENQKIKTFDLYMQKGAGKSARAYFLTY